MSGKLSVVTDPLGSTTSTTYDIDDRVHTVTQQVSATENRQRTYSYDALGRVYQLADTTSGNPGTVLETHAYTPNGKEQSFTDARNNSISYFYDGFDRPDHTVYPDQSTEQYQHDLNGNVVQKTTRSGLTIGFTYDALNRLSTKTPQGEAAGPVTYVYDLSGRLVQASDGSSSLPYIIGYDSAGRANSYTDQQGRNTQVEFDAVGNATRLQWPAYTDGASPYFVTYQYDTLNRMTDVLENGSSANLLAHYDWDSLSRQTMITYGDGTTDTYAQYDAGDNLHTLTQTFAGTNNSVTFSYDWYSNHQRKSLAIDNNAFQYVPNTAAVTYAPADANNRYIDSTNVAGGQTTYTYDGNQNLTFDGANTLTYDVENRLIQAQNGAWGTSQYLYDPLGNRKQKQVSGVVTEFVLAGAQEIADYDCTNDVCLPRTLTVRGVGGLPLAQIVPAGDASQQENIAYYHHDALGSTVAATIPGVDGAAETYTYGEFGESAGGSLPYQFAGYHYDGETGLYYVRARYYSPTLGRFLQTDPVGIMGGTNLYAYVGDDPLNAIDPLGLMPDKPAQQQNTMVQQQSDSPEAAKASAQRAGAVSSQKIGNVWFNAYGGSAAERSAQLAVMSQDLTTTDRGGEMLKVLEGRKSGFLGLWGDPQPFDIILWANPLKSYSTQGGNFIVLDPSQIGAPYTSATGGGTYSLQRIFAHEMGHAAMRNLDNGPGAMNNVNWNENVLMRQLGDFNDRTTY